MTDERTKLEAMLLAEHSKGQTLAVARYIGGDVDRFAAAWEVFCKGDPPLPQRMAWVLDHLTAAHPSHAVRYASSIVDRLPYMQHPAELRAATKILARIELPAGSEGPLLDLLFPMLMDPQVPTAIRVHAMSILYRISQREPDLKRELLLVIEEQMEEGSPGIVSRGRKLAAKLRDELRKAADNQG